MQCRAELAQLLSKTIPLLFPNRHFQQLPAGSISLQEIEQQQAQALPKPAQAGVQPGQGNYSFQRIAPLHASL